MYGYCQTPFVKRLNIIDYEENIIGHIGTVRIIASFNVQGRQDNRLW